ncbi:MAG TPA: DHA2 family efflux MFS transporter permease subunit [Propionicimonas sp.]|nr:DHA2 family efflux MFS transporter permease subunit [Propionicimonas sp.]HQA77382.1 DHA2 family efflux MFS transporter permease subunit [Propionicimonas sp.]
MSTNTAATVEPEVVDRLPATSVRVLAVLLVGAFVVILNETALNVALSRIMTDLSIDERTAQWLTTGFMLTMAVVIPITGWLMERFATRTVFTLAMSLFSVGTLVAALGWAFPSLLAGRIIQASGTAIMMPLLMTTVMELVPAKLRGRVMGTISLVISAAPAIGPTLSGVILQFLPWRFVFVLVLPIALAILLLGLRQVPNLNTPVAVKLDVLSIPLTGFGFGGLVYGLSLVGSPTAGWLLEAALGVGVVSLGLFIWRQLVLQRTDAALLDLRTFTYPIFTTALGVMAIAMAVLFGTIIALPLILQQVLHAEPLYVGLLLLPGALLTGLLGPVVGRLYDRVGPRWLIVPGAVAVSVALGLFGQLAVTTQWWQLLIAHLTLSLGLAFMFTPLFTITLGALPPHLYGHGSAMLGTVQQVAGAAGTALFVTVMAGVAAAQPETLGAEQSLAAGARAAFLTVGAIWLVGFLATLFLRKPEDSEAGAPPVH